MGRPGARRLWFTVHLYLGLVAGVAFAILGLTGSVLVFSDEIDRALNRELGVTRPHGAATVAPDTVLKSVEAQTGQRPYLLELPTDSGDYFLAFTKDKGEDAGAIRAVIVDPVTGGVLADRPFGGYFVSFMRRIHTSLLLEDPGHWIVGALGLLGLISFGTGLYLWWPRAGAWRKALSFHWQRRAVPFNFELHRISGFYLLIVLIVVTGSGIYLATPQPIDAAVEALTEATPYPESMQVNAPFRGAPRQTLQQTAKIVRDRIPAAVLTGFYIPPSDDESYTAYFRGPDEPDSAFGRSALWIDPYTGKVLYERSYVRLGAMDRFLALQILLHNGEIAGTLGEWIVFLSGIVMTALFATGVYLWWAKRRPRRRTALDPRSQEASAFQRSS